MHNSITFNIFKYWKCNSKVFHTATKVFFVLRSTYYSRYPLWYVYCTQHENFGCISQITRVQKNMKYSICVFRYTCPYCVGAKCVYSNAKAACIFKCAAQSHRKGINGIFLIFKTKTCEWAAQKIQASYATHYWRFAPTQLEHVQRKHRLNISVLAFNSL